jgi:hypothetical protein
VLKKTKSDAHVTDPHFIIKIRGNWAHRSVIERLHSIPALPKQKPNQQKENELYSPPNLRLLKAARRDQNVLVNGEELEYSSPFLGAVLD